MQRIIIHWTAGGNRASSLDKQHYHMLVEYDGTIVKGTKRPEDNIVTSDGDYAAHTRNLNTGSIGVAMCGMRGAKESPFDPGPSPLTEKQFRTCAILVADLCREYSIPVTNRTVLTHAEVEPTLGVKQRGKWDITRIPFEPTVVGAIPVGDYFRSLVKEVMGDNPLNDYNSRPILRAGNTNPREDVRNLQRDLATLGYHSGNIDGLFGRNTRGAVMAFQADNSLYVDGIVGKETWSKLDNARSKPLRLTSESELRDKGSETIQLADEGEKQVKRGAIGIGSLAGLEVGSEALTTFADSGSTLGQAQELLYDNWPILLIIAIAALIYFKGEKIMSLIRARRVQDHQEGKHLGR